MPPPVRQRYNAKARQSTLGGSSHKKRSKGKGKAVADRSDDVEGDVDMDGNNEEEWVPEKEKGSRAEEIRRSLVSDDQQMSSKKRKRLDSYIAKKLKQESRLESLSILAQHALPSHLPSNLLSTSTLGQNPLKPLTAQEKAARREDIGVRRALDRQGKKGVGMFDDDDGEPEDDGMGVMGDGGNEKFRREKEERKAVRNGQVVVVGEDGMEVDDVAADATGAGPTSSKKAKKGGAGQQASWGRFLSTQPTQDDSSDFDSSDSENDEDPPSSAPAATIDAAVEPAPVEKKDGEITEPTVPLVTGFGSALKKRDDGEVVAPKVVKRAEKPKVARMSMRDRKRLRERQAMLDAIAAEEEGSSDEDEEDEDDEDDMSGVEEFQFSEDDVDGEEASGVDGEDDSENEEDEDEGDEEDGSDEEDEDEGEGDSAPEEAQPPAKKRKADNFKAWAMKQTGVASAPDLLALNKPKPEQTTRPSQTASAPHIGPLGADYKIPATSLLHRKVPEPAAATGDGKPAGNTIASTMGPRPKLQRRPSVDESRSQLPVVSEEQPIMEAIFLNPVVIICGETGSGKTTQVPQMLYEAGFGFPGSENPGMIAITQPRRVAAVSLSIRVADELNLPKKSAVVAHQIRYSSTTSPETAIKFMTDGVLLRELAYDFLLKRYSVIVVDEAHERGVNTDVLVGVLSRVAKLREKMWRENKDGVKPLRIVIMSATLRVSDFADNKTLFDKPPPVINISARQHPVTVHFNRRTVGDYVTEAYKKVVKIHARLPPGGVLVFMTGQAEISTLCRKLDKKFSPEAIAARKAASQNAKATISEREKQALEWEKGEDAKVLPGKGAKKNMTDGTLEIEDLDIGYGDDLAGDVDDGEIPEEDPDALDSDDDDDAELGIDKEDSEVPVHVLPLYSLLSNEQQLKVFQPPPEGHRLIVVATNVAETSLTIPNVKYVVDAGRAKERAYDASSGVQTFQVSWVSKASASQRTGRAGRTGPGHCYRLYSSNLFENHFSQFSLPEILRMPIEGIVLQMKSMNIDAVANFPFPTPPDRMGLKAAEELLTHLGALEPPRATEMRAGVEVKNTIGGKITELGKAMSAFPVTPRFAKMLVIGQQHGCLPYVISMVAALSVGDPFLREEALGLMKGQEGEEGEGDEEDVPAEFGTIRSEDMRAKEERKMKRRAFFKSQRQYSALGDGASDLFKVLAVVGAYTYSNGGDAFCAKNFVRAKAMKEIQQLATQITSIARSTLPQTAVSSLPAANAKLSPPNATQLKVLRQILCAGFIDQIAVRKDLVSASSTGRTYDNAKGIAYRAKGVSEDVFIHPSSSLFQAQGGGAPEWVAFGEVVRTSRVWIKSITKINPSWLSTLGKSLCTFSRPLEMPTGSLAKTTSILNKDGSVDPNAREVFVTPHYADLGAELPVIKVVQRRVGGGGRWVTEL